MYSLLIMLLSVIGLQTGSSIVYTARYCPEGFYPYTIGLSCVKIVTEEPLNYSTAVFVAQTVWNETDLAQVKSPVDLKTLSAYASAAGIEPGYPIWVECQGSSGQDCNDELDPDSNCSALLNGAISDVNCTLELPYAVILSFNIQNVPATISQDPIYADPFDFELSAPFPFNDSSISVIWTFNDSDLDSAINISSVDNSLQFPVFNESLAGTYKAFASNGYNKALVFSVYLQSAVFVESVQSQTLVIPEGHIAVFECSSPNSRPTPDISWYNDTSGKPIISGERFLISPLGTLFIRDTTIRDSGRYTCNLTNPAGGASATFELQVIDTSVNESTLNAQFITSPVNQTILEDESATLECVLTSNLVIPAQRINTLTTYLFEVEGSPVNTVVYLPFLIPDVFPSVSYRTSNGAVSVRCQAQVTVFALGSISILSDSAVITPNARPTITFLSSKHIIPLGEPVTITCSFTGLPTPSVQWYFNGYIYGNITSSNDSAEYMTIERFTLSNVGMYQCVATNVHAIAAGNLALSAKDGRPGEVAFSSVLVNEAALNVTWTPPSVLNTLSPILLRYRVIWRSTVSREEMSIGLPYTERSHLVTGLQRGVSYEVGVAALSTAQQGPVTFQIIAIPGEETVSTQSSLSTASTSTVSFGSQSPSTSAQITSSLATVTPSVIAINTGTALSVSTPTIILSVILSVALIVIVVIIVVFISQCIWWRKRGTFGNYSPSKIEEQNQREVMLSVQSQPITPPPPSSGDAASSSPCTRRALFSSAASDSCSELSVETIRVDQLYSSRDELCPEKV